MDVIPFVELHPLFDTRCISFYNEADVKDVIPFVELHPFLYRREVIPFVELHPLFDTRYKLIKHLTLIRCYSSQVLPYCSF